MGRFQLRDDTIALQRDDDGPPLRLVKPNTSIHSKNMDGEGQTHTSMTDELGFCNPSNIYTKNDTFDLISIGDSFTWCLAINPKETWTNKVSELTSLSTYNLGKTGVGLYEYLQILKTHGLKKQPKYVVLAVYGGNDLRDADKYHSFKNNTTQSDVRKKEPHFMIKKIIQYSYAANLINSALIADFIIPPHKLSRKDINFQYDLISHTQKIAFNVENTDKDEVIFAEKFSKNQVNLTLFDKALEEFNHLAQKNDFIPILIYIPSAHITYKEYVKFSNPKLKEVMFGFDQAQREYFREKATDLNLKFIDLTLSLQSYVHLSGLDKLLYFRGNLHLTKDGHHQIAVAISNEMEKTMPR